jgi:hypothetical protein
MDIMTYDEITSILAMHGRRDLIIEFQDNVKVDEDYKPPIRTRKDSLSDTEGSATEESVEFEVDEEGFMSLK